MREILIGLALFGNIVVWGIAYIGYSRGGGDSDFETASRTEPSVQLQLMTIQTPTRAFIHRPADWRYNANDRRERPYDRRQKHDRRDRIERRCPAGGGTSGQPVGRLNRIWALLRALFGFERRLTDDRRRTVLRRHLSDRR
ncbi:MAG: hypothetical protein O3A84_15285, partial [Proteobacteria bacterium]|nr:hypothetical protein [Pseudomonadota bacterium]